ncbi:1-acyl-sn-glycerol-3-phosphate acyltransferase [Actinosynnema sp. ALI-1.44]|nr:lysophospholipid acyltransferase family protein [Actinosynnema sp. ALI-1.44]ONI71251.1 1-acyl-sn-glycerol-3-phosphate acyltransferase [Actinosynnema sp. ALI-1.44]
MVALYRDGDEPTRRTTPGSSISPVWRGMLETNRGFVALAGNLRVTGTVPQELRNEPLVFAPNHIGVFDPFVVLKACYQIGIAPKFMLAAGLLDTPVVGWGLRHAGALRVERGQSTVLESFAKAVEAIKAADAPLLVYPEGRITHERGMWPERGKTGVARIALAANAKVIPISQWGAHEAAVWGTETVRGWSDIKPVLGSFLRAMTRRPTFKVHFGDPIDLADLSSDKPGDAVRAHRRIMQAITDNLVELRPDEPDMPAFHDPTRPTDTVSPWRP